MYKFEDKINVIDSEIAKRRNRWRLKAIPSIDFDDVSQILRLHIYKKWYQWDQALPIEPWLNRVITNQIINLIRNLYGNYARPCVSGDGGKPCAANQGPSPSEKELGLCAIYGTQCSACPIFAYWEKHKKSAHDTKLPLPLESHSQEIYNIPEESFDISRQVEELREKLKISLTSLQYKIYTYLFIEGKTEDEVAKILGYNTSERGRSPGYKTIGTTRKLIVERAKRIIEKDM